jgi:hypothetical protein
VFSNYSPNNVPRPGRQWSLMAEVSESSQKPVDRSRVVGDVLAGFEQCGLTEPGAVPLSTWHRRLEHGYPTPWLGRDRVLDAVLSALASVDIFSRGRFGAWRYEVANQDHSVMQGVEAVDHILLGAEERIYRNLPAVPPAAAPAQPPDRALVGGTSPVARSGSR